MKKVIKLVTITAASTILGSAVVPSVVSFADTTNNNSVIVKTNDGTKSFDELYSELSSEKKQEFQDIVNTQGLNYSQQYQLLQDRNAQTTPSRFPSKWKVSVLKKAVEYGAKILGAKMGEKTATDFVNYLTDFEGNIQTGLENGMVKYLHVNRTAAKWAAKTVVFVFF